MQTNNIRTLFLLKFIEKILTNTSIYEQTLAKKPEVLIEKIGLNKNLQSGNLAEQNAAKRFVPQFSQSPAIEFSSGEQTYETAGQKMIVNIKEINAYDYPEHLPPKSEQKIQNLRQIDKPRISKNIEQFLANQSIKAIECPGPEKQLILTKDKEVILASLTLNEKQIREIINELAPKAPQKALVRQETMQYVLTALISEFAGSRFLIVKK